ncbi:MAG: hypothetical protein KF874_02875 [Rhizobiaceae bacterium]|nr:hypothetical protein [Rhizobiaceae bacterium]
MASQKKMFNRMIAHFAADRKAPAKNKEFNALESRYVDSLAKIYARVYGR